MPSIADHRRRQPCVLETVERRFLLATLPVTSLADSGTGSLRNMIAAADPGDTVDLSALSGTITLASVITISTDVTIAGPGAARLTISGNDHATQAFSVEPRTHFAIRDLTIDAAGTANSGTGAITISDASSNVGHSASLTLDRVVMSDNLSSNRGGAIYANYATLTIRDSTFIDNHVAATYFAYGGAIASERMQGLTIANTTFADNTAASVGDPMDPDSSMMTGGAYGGALVAYGENTALPMSITNSTFVNNAVSINGFEYGRGDGAGIAIYSSGPISMTNNTLAGNAIVNPAGNHPAAGGTSARQASGISLETASSLSFVNNIVAGNTGGTTHDLWLDPALASSATNNLIGDGTDSNLTNGVNGNLVGTTLAPIDPQLDALADHGGPVQTMPIAATSPAARAGLAGTTATDARGIARSASRPSIGAFEVVTPAAIELVDGTLTVRGTTGDDDIHVWTRLNGTQVRVSRNGTLRNFDRSLVTGVRVEGDDGADAIHVNADTLPADVYGGRGDDTILGGDGDDSLGGGGNDVIYGYVGIDLLRGHGGLETLFGGAGDDRLYGGDGRDRLDGEAGTDRLWGEAGRDTFFAQDGQIDRLYGGTLADNDRAIADKDDEVSDIAVLFG